MSACVIGIDVSKAELAVAVTPGGEQWTSETAPDAVDRLVARLAGLRPQLMVCEATGGDEMPLAAACAAAG